ncbi:ABC-2 family transporter protein [Ruminococcus flavefaciens]|uniref:ABC-2 family transporter protein n=1 Tax=Ruminococcus flavefaciens TaxID=1265 RepID=A0A1H6IAQ3_RUMFL|nr:ABC-2 transporter permease [Ruminococcus flavefaciens]SEH44846.1 ABC-2 family transporter protein [Ruminococcus flavefaciens]
MTGLLYKELKLNSRKLILNLLGAMIYPLLIIFVIKVCDADAKKGVDDEINQQMLTNVMSIIWLSACCIAYFFTAVIQNGLIPQDERKKWAYYVTSTPTGIKGFVGVKYLCSLFIGMVTVTILMFIQSLAADMGALKVDATTIIVGAFYMQIFMRAIEFPLIFRFSSKVGYMVKSCIVVLICIVLFVYFLFGDTSMFANLETFWERFFKFVNDPEQMKKVYLWIGIIAVAVMPLYYLSYRLSVKWYLKGVENYAK